MAGSVFTFSISCGMLLRLWEPLASRPYESAHLCLPIPGIPHRRAEATPGCLPPPSEPTGRRFGPGQRSTSQALCLSASRLALAFRCGSVPREEGSWLLTSLVDDLQASRHSHPSPLYFLSFSLVSLVGSLFRVFLESDSLCRWASFPSPS